MTVIGDNDPEDAYDATDPLPVRLEVLARVAGALDDDPDRRDVRRAGLAQPARRDRRPALVPAGWAPCTRRTWPTSAGAQGWIVVEHPGWETRARGSWRLQPGLP